MERVLSAFPIGEARSTMAAEGTWTAAQLEGRVLAAAAAEPVEVGGILWLEHVNMIVGDRKQAEIFYCDLIGFTPDASSSFHVNLGRQQLHLSVGEPQVVSGSLGLALPSLLPVEQKLAVVREALRDTLFCVVEDAADDSGHGTLTLRCPWGNTVHLYPTSGSLPSTVSSGRPKLVEMQANLDKGMGVSGAPGIRFVQLRTRRGTAQQIADFYASLFNCIVHVDAMGECAVAVVSVGASASLVFTEVDEALLNDEAQAGIHVCVYVDGFRRSYDACEQRGLVFNNPRFVYLDTCATYAEAVASRQFRFKRDAAALQSTSLKQRLHLRAIAKRRRRAPASEHLAHPQRCRLGMSGPLFDF